MGQKNTSKNSVGMGFVSWVLSAPHAPSNLLVPPEAAKDQMTKEAFILSGLCSDMSCVFFLKILFI